MLSTGALLPFPSEDPPVESQDIEMRSFEEVHQDDYPPLAPIRRSAIGDLGTLPPAGEA